MQTVKLALEGELRLINTTSYNTILQLSQNTLKTVAKKNTIFVRASASIFPAFGSPRVWWSCLIKKVLIMDFVLHFSKTLMSEFSQFKSVYCPTNRLRSSYGQDKGYICVWKYCSKEQYICECERNQTRDKGVTTFVELHRWQWHFLQIS